MARIGELDLPDRLRPYARPWVTQLLFALLCSAAAIALRAVLDLVAPGSGPFALGFPAALLATLFARWQAGVLTTAATILYSWYFTLPVVNSFRFADPRDAGRVALAAVCYLAIVYVAERFRAAVRRAAAERDREIADRDLMLQEFEHRVKNNFALVASLLELQRRRTSDPGTTDALSAALARIESIARAHRHLYRGTAGATVDMASYLQELCSALSEALFLRATIALVCEADHAEMPRDRAVSIGLIVNELVTNAAKHAFRGTDAGTIRVEFGAAGAGWRLTVADNGRGIDPEPRPGQDGGLGQRLVEAFAKQAGGTLDIESGTEGTAVTVTLAA